MVNKTNTNTNDYLNKQNCDFSLNTIGEFTLDNHHYLILLLPGGYKNSQSRKLEEKSLPEISHFEIEGQYCAIVEAESVPASNKPGIVDLLTERELQIATLIALGRVNKQIARKLHISEWTVATYIRRIFYKLGVDSRAAMVYRCAPLIQQLQTLE